MDLQEYDYYEANAAGVNLEQVTLASYRIENAKVSVGCPLSSCSVSGKERGTSFQFHFRDFANLSNTKSHYIASPEFTCYGHRWELGVFPGGAANAVEGQVSVFLFHLSVEDITTRYGIKVIDKFGKTVKEQSSLVKQNFSIFGLPSTSWGWPNFISRSVILDESQNILDSDGTLYGTLTIVVSIEEEPTAVFVPKNPHFLKGLFNDENTADVCFEVSSIDGKEGEKKKSMSSISFFSSKSSVSFYAHRLILEKWAPMLAAICGPNDSGGLVTASVNDVKPDVFRHLLHYVYGGSIPEEEIKSHAKDIIDAADKYSIVNLKLQAEAIYVQSVDITLDNAMDNLLYADRKNCALLKEAVMNFLAENQIAAAAKFSFTDCPGHFMKDLLIAVVRNSKKDASLFLSVSELRRKLGSLGLEVDGSREAMIESIRSHSGSIVG